MRARGWCQSCLLGPFLAWLASPPTLCSSDFPAHPPRSVIGTPFYLMGFLEGRVFRDPTLPGVTGPKERAACFLEMLRTLAAIHSVDWRARGLEGFGKAGGWVDQTRDKRRC